MRCSLDPPGLREAAKAAHESFASFIDSAAKIVCAWVFELWSRSDINIYSRLAQVDFIYFLTALSCNIIQGAWLQKIHEGHITHQDKLECQWSSVLQEPPRLMKLARCLRFL